MMKKTSKYFALLTSVALALSAISCTPEVGGGEVESSDTNTTEQTSTTTSTLTELSFTCPACNTDFKFSVSDCTTWGEIKDKNSSVLMIDHDHIAHICTNGYIYYKDTNGKINHLKETDKFDSTETYLID